MATLGTGNVLNELTADEHAEVNGRGAKKVVLLDKDGNLVIGGDLAYQFLTSGSTTYVAAATVGSDTTDPVWQVMKIDGGSITWADGDNAFDNTADDLAALTYS